MEATEEIAEEQIKEVDGRTLAGKRLKAIEDSQAKILETLADHEKRIAECSIRR